VVYNINLFNSSMGRYILAVKETEFNYMKSQPLSRARFTPSFAYLMPKWRNETGNTNSYIYGLPILLKSGCDYDFNNAAIFAIILFTRSCSFIISTTKCHR